MGWFWADSPSTTRAPARSVAVDSSSSNNSRCPVDHSKWSSSSCPHHSGSANALNPRNNMPNLPNEPLHATPGASPLPTAREISSIPMNSEGERWQYPSPQQMLNAMTRKGYDGTSPEDVPAMVAVHNWLNEGSWEEILKWERKYFPDNVRPHLVRFSGRPGKPTPKSYLLYVTGRSPKAFDHHEWFVSRADGKSTRRYVIDYYGVDELTFSVDVRPAIDDFETLKVRALNLAEKMKERVIGKKDE